MKKLLILAPPIPPNHIGGDGKFSLDIALELSKRKINVVLFSPSYNRSFKNNKLNRYLRSIQIPIEDKTSKDGWDFPIWKPTFTKNRDDTFLWYLKKFDMINGGTWIHEIGGSIYNSLLINLHKKNNIQYSCHIQFVLANYDKLIPNSRLYKELTLNSQKEYINCSRTAFFLSEMDEAPFKNLLRNYSIVPNGVDLRSYKINKIKHDGVFKVFIGGRLYSKMKGAEKIFPILSKLLIKVKTLEIHICAPDKSNFRLFNKSIIRRVVYHGWMSVKNTQEIIRNCHVSLVPSIYEPFGLIALESLANGVPVLATKTGGLSEIIKPGINGEFIDLDNPKDTELFLINFILDNQLIERYDRSAIRKTIERYDISKVGKLYLKNLKYYL